MDERQQLLQFIANMIQDYQHIQYIPQESRTEHVDTWVQQFDAHVQVLILQEMDYVLKRTYFSKDQIVSILKNDLLHSQKLVGNNPRNFWKSVNFLDIQLRGNSQKDILDLFDEILQESYNFGIEDCGHNSNTFVYIDDGIFTGDHVKKDLITWFKQPSTPKRIQLHIITIALHTSYWYAEKEILNKAKEMKIHGLDSDTLWFSEIELENRKKYINSSDVLNPTEIPDIPEVNKYIDSLDFDPVLRNHRFFHKKSKVFSSEKSRNVLEQEFLKAGVRIQNICPYLESFFLPLGYRHWKSLGFGSLFVTYRNCPNNAPLALWVGDPWYPLFPRKTNQQSEDERLYKGLTGGFPDE